MHVLFDRLQECENVFQRAAENTDLDPIRRFLRMQRAFEDMFFIALQSLEIEPSLSEIMLDYALDFIVREDLANTSIAVAFSAASFENSFAMSLKRNMKRARINLEARTIPTDYRLY